MKKWVVVSWLIFLLAGISALFWRYEWVYNLPTPVPVGYQEVKPGTRIDLVSLRSSGEKRPVFLHFFNPDCPCSRFNMPHFRALVKAYHRQIDFAIVLMTDKKYTADQIRNRFDLPYPVPVLTDSNLAKSCGVYSTPQAVLIDTSEKLYYRGNYNRSRYCSDEKSSYAKMAVEGLLQNNPTQNFNPLALTAYGCQLPTCTR